VTAEESGLLGSAHFGQNPTVPIECIAANVNVDGGNLKAGAVHLAEIVLRFGMLVANAPTPPTWNRDAEFRAHRPLVP
jgi:Zn-dependent M28 family amino/carboxypeptidase